MALAEGQSSCCRKVSCTASHTLPPSRHSSKLLRSGNTAPECGMLTGLRLCMQVYGYGGGKCTAALVHAPVAVLPTPFPRGSFQKAQRAMQAFNLVTDRITRDPTYLQQTLASAAALDEFTVSATLRPAVACGSKQGCNHWGCTRGLGAVCICIGVLRALNQSACMQSGAIAAAHRLLLACP